MKTIPSRRWSAVAIAAFTLGAALCLAPREGAAQTGSVLSLLSTDGRSLEVGAEMTGALSASDPRAPDDAPLEAWSLDGSAGESVTIDLHASDFDPYLYLIGPGFDETLRDDDGAGGCDARLTVTFLESGSFTVVASSQSGGTGPYTLSVTTSPDPATPYSCGGVNPATLLELPTEGRTLELGAFQWGSFDGTEATIEEGRPAVAWALEGRAGESLSVRLISDDFDSYLYLFGPGMTDVLSDDDGAGDLNSQLTVRFTRDGSYRVIASALSGGAVGSYTLEVLEPADPTTLPTGNRRAVVGETVSGSLPTSGPVVFDGRPGQAWALEGQAGRSVTVELRSDDFDPYLYLAGPGLDEPLEDDDGAGGMDSRLTLTFPESGTYRLIVSAFSSGSGGAFDLSVEQN